MREEIDRVFEAAMQVYRTRQEWWDLPPDEDSCRDARKKDHEAVGNLFRACQEYEKVIGRQTDSWKAIFAIGCARRYVEDAIDSIRINADMSAVEAGQHMAILTTLLMPLDDVDIRIKKLMETKGE